MGSVWWRVRKTTKTLFRPNYKFVQKKCMKNVNNRNGKSLNTLTRIVHIHECIHVERQKRKPSEIKTSRSKNIAYVHVNLTGVCVGWGPRKTIVVCCLFSLLSLCCSTNWIKRDWKSIFLHSNQSEKREDGSQHKHGPIQMNTEHPKTQTQRWIARIVGQFKKAVFRDKSKCKYSKQKRSVWPNNKRWCDLKQCYFGK